MAAGALDEKMCIRAHNETPIDIYECPWQHLKHEVLEVTTRARHRHAAQQRTALKGIAELDNFIIKKLRAKQNDEEARIVGATMSLATWDDQQKAALDYKEDDLCFICGLQPGTFAHMVGRCTGLEHIREDKELAAICHLLPDPILLGIPAAMCADWNEPWWGGGDRWPGAGELKETKVAKKLFGEALITTRAFARLKRRTPDELTMNARQFMRHLRGTFPATPWNMPSPCTDAPPCSH
jgi:hypothetical protein